MGDPSIMDLTTRLAEGKIDPALRDQLASELDWAQSINGHPEPAMQGIKRLVISGVRRELLAYERDRENRDEINGIIANCEARHVGDAKAALANAQSVNNQASWVQTVVIIAKAVSPLKWPIAVAACSPWTPSIIQTIASACAK